MGPCFCGDDVVESTKKTGPRGPVLSSSLRATSIVAAIEAVMMVMMVMTVSARHDDDAGRLIIPIISAICVVVVMMMVVVVVMVELGKLNVFVRRRGRRGFIDRLQQRSRVRDRLEKVGEGIRPQNVGWSRTRGRRGLRGIECPERRHRSQKSSDLLVHFLSSNSMLQCAFCPYSATRPSKDGSCDNLGMMSD